MLTGSYAETAKAHKALYQFGDDAVEPVLRELRQIDLAQVNYPETLTLVTGLISILHDLSEVSSVEFAEDALTRPCYPAIAAVLKSNLRLRRSDYRETEVLGITVLEEKAIDARYQATNHVSRWLHNVPRNDLADISRLYIITQQSHQEFLGTYQPDLAIITLAWMTEVHPYIPLQWVLRMSHEGTLYHEVGHHREGHTEYGQDPEQEKQADAYARNLLRQTHPVLARIGRALRSLRRTKPKQDSNS